MNLKSTILLLVLAGGCVALFWKGPELAPRLGLAPKPIATTDLGSSQLLADLPVDQITKVEIESAGKTTMVLHRPAPGQPLQLLGSWPLRRGEADELLNTLRDLKSRYHPIPIDDNTDLKPYGLADSQSPIVVEIARDKQIIVLRFGEAPAEPGVNPFTLASYVRVGETTQDERELAAIEKRQIRIRYRNEVIRLGPHVLPVLRRSEEFYRRRQLFPESIRTRIADGKSTPRIPGMEPPPPPMTFLASDSVKRIDVETPAGRFALERIAPNPSPEVPADKPDGDPVIAPAKLAESWILVEPVRDRLDPDKLRAVLMAVSDLWVEKFLDAVPEQQFFFGLGTHRNVAPQMLAVLGNAMPTGLGESPLRAMLGVASLSELRSNIARVTSTFEHFNLTPKAFERLKATGVPDSITSKLRTLENREFTTAEQFETEVHASLGDDPNKDRSKWLSLIRKEAAFTSQRTLQLGRTARSIGNEELRYATLENNRFVFEIKAEKLNDLQINLASPAPSPGSSPADDLRDPSLVRFDANDVIGVEIQTPGDKAGITIKLRKDGADWKLEQPVTDAADRSEIESLLSLLKGWEARKSDILDGSVRVPIIEAFGVAPLDPKTQLGLLPAQARKVTLTFDAKTARPPVTFLVGQRGGEGKRAVMVDGWNRVNLVNDGGDVQTTSRLDFQPSHYRLVKLTEPGVNTIKEIVVQRMATSDHPADTFTLQADPEKLDQWLVTAPFKAETDRDAVTALANGLRNLANLRYVYDSKIDGPLTSAGRWPKLAAGVGPFTTEFDLASDAFYGFDKPLTVTVKFSKPEKANDLVLEIGRARSNGDHFARVKGSSGIFAVPEAVALNADRKPEDLVDKTLINIPGQEPNVQSLRRSLAGQDLEFSANARGEWELVKPLVAKAETNLIAEMVKDLAKLKGSRIVEIGAKDLKKYGLEPPVASIVIEVIERGKLVEKQLLIGSPVNDKEPDGERFVKAQGSSTVAVIAAPLAKKLTAGTSTFRDRTLGEGFVSADKLVMERGERKITFVKGAGGWKVMEPLTADAEDQDLRDLHDAMAAKPKGEEIVEDKPKDLAKYGLDKPEHVRFFRGDKEVLHLRVGSLEKVGMEKKTAGLRAYAMLDKGDTVFLLDWRLTHMLTAEYRSRDLWPALQPDKITEITVKAADPKDAFSFVKGPMGWSDPARKTDTLKQEDIADLAFGLADLRVDRFAIDKGAVDLKPFGLDKPRTVTFTADGKKQTLLLGNLLDGKKLYAKLDDASRTDVFLLSESVSKVLNRSRADYVVKKDEPKKEPEPKKKDEPKKE